MLAESLAGAASRLRTCAAILVLIGLAVSAIAADNAITGINVANQPDRVVITVKANCAIKMTPLVSTAGRYVGFQFPCRLAAKGRLVGVRSGRIYNVRYSNYSPHPPTTRIVVNCSGHVDYKTTWSPDKRQLDICVMKAKGAKAQEQSRKETTQVVAQPPSPVPARPTDLASSKPVVRVMGITEVKTGDAQEPAPVQSPAKLDEPRVRVASLNAVPTAATAAKPRLLARAAAVEQTEPETNRRISLSIRDADVKDVLNALSVQSGCNIVAGKDVTGELAVSLNNVTVSEALDYIAKVGGYSYTHDNGVYLVSAGSGSGPKDSGPVLSDGDMELVEIRHSDPEQVVAVVQSRVPNLSAMVFTRKAQSSDRKASKQPDKKQEPVYELDQAGDLIILTGSRELIDKGKQVVTALEKAAEVHTEQARKWIDDKKREIYRVKYVDASELADLLRSLVPGIAVAFAPSEGVQIHDLGTIKEDETGTTVVRAAGEGLPSTPPSPGTDTGPAEEGAKLNETRSRTLVILGTQDAVTKALEIATALDVKSPQIKIDAKITSLSESGEKKLGVTWDWGSVDFKEALLIGPDPGVDGVDPTMKATRTWNRGAFDFSATLDALVTDGDAELLASPSITSLEGKAGVFFVGDEVTYIQRIEVTPTGQNIVTDTKRVGVQLRVAGDVSPDGYITLNLHPEVSVLKLVVEQGVSLPIVTRRFTDHIVRVRDGQTLVIGGLIRNDDIEQMRKVPLLGDLPVLGHLFRHRSTTKDHTEVVMFITASVLKD